MNTVKEIVMKRKDKLKIFINKVFLSKLLKYDKSCVINVTKVNGEKKILNPYAVDNIEILNKGQLVVLNNDEKFTIKESYSEIISQVVNLRNRLISEHKLLRVQPDF